MLSADEKLSIRLFGGENIGRNRKKVKKPEAPEACIARAERGARDRPAHGARKGKKIYLTLISDGRIFALSVREGSTVSDFASQVGMPHLLHALIISETFLRFPCDALSPEFERKPPIEVVRNGVVPPIKIPDNRGNPLPVIALLRPETLRVDRIPDKLAQRQKKIYPSSIHRGGMHRLPELRPEGKREAAHAERIQEFSLHERSAGQRR